MANPLNDAEFLLVKQTRPPKFNDEEYDSYVDSDLWDLPSTQLNLLEVKSEPSIAVEGAESWSGKIELKKFVVDSALNRVLEQVGFKAADVGDWSLLKYVEEAHFGPGPPINSVFVRGKLVASHPNLPESCKWLSVPSCLNWLLEVKPGNDRVGPLIVAGLLNEFVQSRELKIPSTLSYQEYPPGVVLVPMGSKTGKPFYTTNLVVFAPQNASSDSEKNGFIASGDALIVDPGCRSEFHEELAQIVTSLPRKLVVFVTHHHHDHVDVIQRCNPDATLLAHENTMRRIGKDDWSLGFTAISGTEEICIGGQRLIALFSPGHTDGHMGLLHASTHSLIVGDHCVGNRRARESSILKAIENGAETLFDIVANVYSEVDPSIWIFAASNVRLHVDHLAQQDKLPKGFYLETFYHSIDELSDKV
ncbi:Metallo-hydrolase/oxidoreductase superfamily protein [Prunus dulcis]|uniref:Metallo-hydrolase/oxidoreductase superfamily protein n=1 Tax=Prunus dulcis TaxID=3755 RepID=A0A4Y1QRP9_PRUDU|nr:Metallo-hydrolase/oxidoreductase superfamily protein [Prunus dulcis]